MFFGSNDASKDVSQKVPIPRYKENLTYIVKALQAVGAKVILIGPAVHDEVHRNQLFEGDPLNNPRSTLRNREYGAAAASVAKELGVPFIDLWHVFMASVGWKEGDPLPGQLVSNSTHPSGVQSELSVRHLLNDGLHFTGAGYKLLYNEIERVLLTEYPEFVPTELPFLFPDCRAFEDPTVSQRVFETRAGESHRN